MATEHDDFIQTYQDLEADRLTRNRRCGVMAGTTVVGALVGIVTRNAEAGVLVAVLPNLALLKPTLEMHASVSLIRDHLDLLTRRHLAETALDPPEAMPTG